MKKMNGSIMPQLMRYLQTSEGSTTQNTSTR